MEGNNDLKKMCENYSFILGDVSRGLLIGVSKIENVYYCPVDWDNEIEGPFFNVIGYNYYLINKDGVDSFLFFDKSLLKFKDYGIFSDKGSLYFSLEGKDDNCDDVEYEGCYLEGSYIKVSGKCNKKLRSKKNKKRKILKNK